MFSSIFSTFFAGFLTSLTPCVYPMIPLSLGYLGSRGSGLRRQTVVSFVFGQVVMFGVMGLVAVQLGEVFGFLSENNSVQIGTGVFLGIFAYYSWKQELPAVFNKLNFGSQISTEKKEFSLASAFFAGLLSALVASPCSTPVLGGVLVMISNADSLLIGGLLMMVYGLGLSTLFLVLGLGLLKTQTLPRSGVWMKKIHLVSVVLLAASSLYFLGKGLSLWNF